MVNNETNKNRMLMASVDFSKTVHVYSERVNAESTGISENASAIKGIKGMNGHNAVYEKLGSKIIAVGEQVAVMYNANELSPKELNQIHDQATNGVVKMSPQMETCASFPEISL